MENDINIINLVKKGDVRAFDILVVKYQDRLVYSVFKFCKDFELSQDIAQEAFVKAFRNIDKFRGDSSFYTWIYRIAINTAKNYFSNKSRGAETYNEDVLDGALSDLSLNSDNPETLLAAEEMKDAVNQAFQNLPDEIRIGAILRGDDIIIPRSSFVFQKDDKVVFLAKNDQIELVENMFRISAA